MKSKRAKKFIQDCFNGSRGNMDDAEVVKACTIAENEMKVHLLEYLTEEQKDQVVSEFIKDINPEGLIKLSQYILIMLTDMSVKANSAETTISTELTLDNQRYEAKMVVTHKKIK